jgi:hypothetical protein
MSDLRFEFDWQDPAGARGEELRATWASLTIWIGEHLITEMVDKRTRGVRKNIFVPLFPLAEWLADNWWFLKSEVARPAARVPSEFDRRHNIRWAREGYVLPSLRFVTVGEDVEAEWQSLEIADAGIRFLANGRAVLSGDVIDAGLREFVNAVITRLDDMGLTRTTLHDQWLAIQDADSEEQAFCNAAARLGVDPYAIDHQLEQEVLDVSRRIRPDVLNDFLSLASIDQLATQESHLVSAAQEIESDTDDVDAIDGVRSRAPSLIRWENPWVTGYKYAEELRAKLNGGTWKSRSLYDVAGHLGIDQLEHCILPGKGGCRFLDALTGLNQRGNPKFLIEKKREDSRQFAFCRALFEHLTSPRGRFAVVSGLRTERQQMSRAFAAEILAPHWMLKSDLSGPVIGEDEVEDLATEYGVSTFVVKHQIENHNLARVAN